MKKSILLNNFLGKRLLVEEGSLMENFSTVRMFLGNVKRNP